MSDNQTQPQVLIVYEYLDSPRTLLHELSINESLYTEFTVRTFMRMVLEGVKYFHSKNVVHRNLRMENVLICTAADGSRVVKLIGFEQAQLTEFTNLNGKAGTLLYTAPEVLDGKNYGSAVDIYALGIILHMIVSGTLAFEGKDPKIVTTKIKRSESQFKWKNWSKVTAEVKELVKSVLVSDARKRLKVSLSFLILFFFSLFLSFFLSFFLSLCLCLSLSLSRSLSYI